MVNEDLALARRDQHSASGGFMQYSSNEDEMRHVRGA